MAQLFELQVAFSTGERGSAAVYDCSPYHRPSPMLFKFPVTLFKAFYSWIGRRIAHNSIPCPVNAVLSFLSSHVRGSAVRPVALQDKL